MDALNLQLCCPHGERLPRLPGAGAGSGGAGGMLVVPTPGWWEAAVLLAGPVLAGLRCSTLPLSALGARPWASIPVLITSDPSNTSIPVLNILVLITTTSWS